MRTPAGRECRYFYGDYHRGREIEECRLLNSANPPIEWKPQMCFTCPVPDILLANACPNMVLQPRLERPFPYVFVKSQVRVEAYCTKTTRKVTEPRIGCGECHPLPMVFSQAEPPPDEE